MQQAEPPAQASPSTCPRCKGELFATGVDGITVHHCAGCGGVWVDDASIRRAMERVRAAKGKHVEALAVLTSEAAERNANVSPPIACPVCGSHLQRWKVTKHEVLIDRCDQHGTWFDRYELGTVLDAYHPPARPTKYHGEMPETVHYDPDKDLWLGVIAQAVGAVVPAAGAALDAGRRIHEATDPSRPKE